MFTTLQQAKRVLEKIPDLGFQKIIEKLSYSFESAIYSQK